MDPRPLVVHLELHQVPHGCLGAAGAAIAKRAAADREGLPARRPPIAKAFRLDWFLSFTSPALLLLTYSDVIESASSCTEAAWMRCSSQSLLFLLPR